MKNYDYLVVGAGLYGATFAYIASRCGKRVLVIDRRDTTGGNIRCDKIADINVHKYGAHIFHTSNREVWSLVTSLVYFNRYTNSPLARHGENLYNLPFNMNTFKQIWGVTTPQDAMAKIMAERETAARMLAENGVREARNLEEQACLLVGNEIYRLLIKEYTEKQWGRKCSELPAFIIKRLPLRFTFDNNYFNDTFQGIPEGGYNILVDRMLEGIKVITGVDFIKERHYWQSQAEKVLFTGQIDEYFDYCYGPLQYRSVRFETEVLQMSNYQGNAVVNYTDLSQPFTRIIEHKHFETFGDEIYDNPYTVISREYSTEWRKGLEPFYPINNPHNTSLYERYRQLAAQEVDVVFGGRLGLYRYLDMDKVIASSMDLARKLMALSN